MLCPTLAVGSPFNPFTPGQRILGYFEELGVFPELLELPELLLLGLLLLLEGDEPEELLPLWLELPLEVPPLSDELLLLPGDELLELLFV